MHYARLWTICLILIPAASSRAEIMVGESIGWLVADSDVVLRGKLVDVRTSSSNDQVTWDQATIEVEETLKGKPVERATFDVQHLRGGATAKSLQPKQAEVLVFLVGQAKYLSTPRGLEVTGLSLRQRWGQLSYFILKDKDATPAFTAGCDVLKSRKKILAAVRQSVDRQAGQAKPHEYRVEVPYSSEVFRALWGGSAVYLVVAADGRLEMQAQEWIKSEDLLRRQQGAEALQHFKTPENIQRLRSLLDDPGFWVTTQGDSRIRVYGIRQSAYDVLKKWDVEVERPVLEEPLP